MIITSDSSKYAFATKICQNINQSLFVIGNVDATSRVVFSLIFKVLMDFRGSSVGNEFAINRAMSLDMRDHLSTENATLEITRFVFECAFVMCTIRGRSTSRISSIAFSPVLPGIL